MSLIKSNHGGLGGSGAPGGALGSFYSHTIDQSLRFNDDDSAYLSRTPSSASNRRTFTFSAWIKVNPAATNYPPIFSADNSTPDFVIRLSNTGSLQVVVENGGGGNSLLLTNRLFRDSSSWYHIVVAIDTTNSTADDRIKIYVNGVQETSFSSRTNPSLNFETKVNNTVLHRLGLQRYGSYWDGYMAEVNFLDGLAYDPSYFGETKDGVWIAKQYSGSYGTNGFHLTFADSSAIGDDTSGNGNDFTANNLAAIDVVPDSPTNNFATLNPIGEFYGESSNTKTFSEGNLKVAQSGGGSHDTATIAIETGHTEGYYWEVIVSSMDTARTYIGIVADNPSANASLVATYSFLNKYVLNRNGNFSGNADTSSTTVSTYTAYAQGDIVMVAYKDGKLWMGVNGTWMNSGDPANGTGFLTAQDGTSPSGRNQAAWLPYFGYRSTFIVNFGQNGTFNGTKTAQGNSDENGIGNFYYSVPSGFLTLCTANLPDPTIGPGQTEQADDNFNTVLYTGNGNPNSNSQSITGVGFQPDWVWIKSRGVGRHHMLYDSVRGTTKAIRTSLSNAEVTGATTLTSFDSDGFSLGADSDVNTNAEAFVSWNWKAGGSASSNSNGSITSSVSANQDAGFSIISWTGAGADGTIGHGLTQTPEFFITKDRNNSRNWEGFHKDLTAGYVLYLNLTNAQNNTGNTYFQGGFSASSTNNTTIALSSYMAQTSKPMIGYAFHSVEGYSKVGSYEGNATNYSNGTFVYTGFRPALVMVKAYSTTSNWIVTDNKRASSFNGDTARLYWNTSGAESAYASNRNVELFSNGFRVHGNSASDNSNRINESASYVYLAFAEAPFKFANAR